MTAQDIDELLSAADAQLAEVAKLYPGTLEAKKVGHSLRPKIKNVLENQRSALEYLANEIHQRFGTPPPRGRKVYYPLAPQASEFMSGIDKLMPGVRAARPDIAEAIERHQPYQPGHAWLGWLRDLTNENKHTKLSALKPDEAMRLRFEGGTSLTVSSSMHKSVNFEEAVGKKATATEEVCADWLFTQPQRAALQTLRDIQTGLRAAIEDIRSVAGV